MCIPSLNAGRLPQSANMSESRQFINAHVPVSIAMPEAIRPHLEKVLEGEYEAGHFGSGLTILDPGVNAGASPGWANMRWPSSNIHAFQPQPDTFRILQENVRSLQTISAAVYFQKNARLGLFPDMRGTGTEELRR